MVIETSSVDIVYSSLFGQVFPLATGAALVLSFFFPFCSLTRVLGPELGRLYL